MKSLPEGLPENLKDWFWCPAKQERCPQWQTVDRVVPLAERVLLEALEEARERAVEPVYQR